MDTDNVAIAGLISGVIGVIVSCLSLFLHFVYRPKLVLTYVGLGNGSTGGQKGVERNLKIEITNRSKHPATIRGQALIKYEKDAREYKVNIRTNSRLNKSLFITYGLTEIINVPAYSPKLSREERKNVKIESICLFSSSAKRKLTLNKSDIDKINHELNNWLVTRNVKLS